MWVQGCCYSTLTRPCGGTALAATDVLAWVLTLAAGLRRSQAKTRADLVAAALHVGRGTRSALGRCRPGDTEAKHRIKRVWRFCANDRVHVADALQGLIARLTHRRKKPLLVALDWTANCTAARMPWGRACCGCCGRGGRRGSR